MLTKDVHGIIGTDSLQSEKDYFTLLSEPQRRFITLIEKQADKEERYRFILFGYQKLRVNAFAFIVNVGNVELVAARARLLNKLIENIDSFIKLETSK